MVATAQPKKTPTVKRRSWIAVLSALSALASRKVLWRLNDEAGHTFLKAIFSRARNFLTGPIIGAQMVRCEPIYWGAVGLWAKDDCSIRRQSKPFEILSARRTAYVQKSLMRRRQDFSPSFRWVVLRRRHGWPTRTLAPCGLATWEALANLPWANWVRQMK